MTQSMNVGGPHRGSPFGKKIYNHPDSPRTILARRERLGAHAQAMTDVDPISVASEGKLN